MKKIISIILCCMLWLSTASAKITPELDSSAKLTVKGTNEAVLEGDFGAVKVFDVLENKTIFFDDNVVQQAGSFEFESFDVSDVYGIKIYEITAFVGTEEETVDYVLIRSENAGDDTKIFDDAAALSDENFARAEQALFEYFEAEQHLDALDFEEGKLKAELRAKLGEIETKEELLQEINDMLILGAVKDRMWNQTEELLESWIDVEAMFEDYDSLTDTDKQTLYQYIADTDIDTVEKFKTEMSSKITSILNSKQNSGGGISGGGGTSGGGGSRGGSVKVSGTPATTAPIIPQIKPQQENFGDVPEKHWSYESVSAMRSMNIISGDGDGMFRPDDDITRAEFIKMVVLLIGINSAKDVSFNDVKESDWYYEYICAAYENGIVTGDGNSFMPNNKITREEMAVIISRIIEKYAMEFEAEAKEYADVEDISGWAKDAVTALSKADIMSGYPGNKFMPKESATRAQAAKVLYGLYSMVKES